MMIDKIMLLLGLPESQRLLFENKNFLSRVGEPRTVFQIIEIPKIRFQWVRVNYRYVFIDKPFKDVFWFVQMSSVQNAMAIRFLMGKKD